MVWAAKLDDLATSVQAAEQVLVEAFVALSKKPFCIGLPGVM